MVLQALLVAGGGIGDLVEAVGWVRLMRRMLRALLPLSV